MSTWHNVGEWEAEIKKTPSRTRRVEAGADIHLESLKLPVFDGGFVVQATTAGVSAEGVPVRVPTVLVVTVTDGKIARFEEYADSAAARALFGGEAKDEHFDESSVGTAGAGRTRSRPTRREASADAVGAQPVEAPRPTRPSRPARCSVGSTSLWNAWPAPS